MSVLVEERGPTLVVTLNRPQARNAIDAVMVDELTAALDTLDARADLRCAVITGAGGSFCSGMDLRSWAGVPPAESAAALQRVVRRRGSAPLIAAIEGHAVGGGLELALSCDLIVAAGDAQLGIPEVTRSLVPSGGALLRLPTRVPFAAAMELALTGASLSAQRLYELGLVSAVTAPGQSLEAALALAERIATAGPLAVSASKTLLWELLDSEDPAAWERQAAAVAAVNASADAAEGVASFVEKRAPRFSGH